MKSTYTKKNSTVRILTIEDMLKRNIVVTKKTI